VDKKFRNIILFALLAIIFSFAVLANECEKTLRDIYHEYYDKLTVVDVPPHEKEILDILAKYPQLRPDDAYLVAKGSMAKDFNLEVKLVNQFINEFHSWKSKIVESGVFNQEQSDRIGLNIYGRAILADNPMLPRQIANLSLVYDDIYGSHVYEMIEGVDVYRWAQFLSVRRQLAMNQSSFIANISTRLSNKRAEKLSLHFQQILSDKEIELPEDKRVQFVKKWSDRVLFFIPPMKKHVHGIFAAVEPASPVDPIGTNLAKKYLEQDWMPELLSKFRLRLAEFEKLLDDPKEPAFNELLRINIFDIALEVAEGDIEKAVILVGLMSIQRKALIRKLAPHYAHAGRLENYATPLTDTVSVYYFITDIAETIDTLKKERGLLDKRYSFLYPKGYEVTDNKFYHFWSEVFFSYYLRDNGFSNLSVKFGLSSVGVVYELATSAAGMKFYKEFGMSNWEAFKGTKMLDDMKLHRNGVKFGLQQYKLAQKQKNP
jgi:hypothetical protein